MVVVSYSGKEINAKLVYYGAGLSGKTTNLEAIYEAVPETSRGKMVSMKTQSDRTLFFDLLPLDLGEIMGFKTRFLLYTVPGQVFYNATRKLVLKGADAIVFVADSEVGKMEGNKESLANLRANLAEYNLSLDEIPWVLQFNKRDVPNVYTVEELNAELNPGAKVQSFEAVATKGKGVFETFRGVSHLLMEKVTRDLRRTPFGGATRATTGADISGAAPGPRPAAGEPPRQGHAASEVPRATTPAPPRPTAPEPPPLAVVYGREITLPGEKAHSTPDESAKDKVEVEPSPTFTPPDASTRGGRTTPRHTMPHAPAPGGERATADAADASDDTLVVPLKLSADGSKEIVLKIILKLDRAA